MLHLILVCKYRKPLLVDLGIDIKNLIYEIAEEQDFGILEMEVDTDHIHILLEYNLAQSVLKIVRLLKQISTYRIWRSKHKANLKKEFWKERTFWGDGYFACSIGQVSRETIEKYIQTQG